MTSAVEGQRVLSKFASD